MESKTLEQYFLQDYENTKAENERLRERLRELEDHGHDFGVTDLHRKFQAVKGSTCSSWVIGNCLKKGSMTPDIVRMAMALDDEALFNKYKNKSFNYCTIISYEEHEFQYTLYVRESRDEWTAVTDGTIGSSLKEINDRKLGEDLCEDEWYPIEEADAIKAFLAQGLRELMEEALEEYEREQREKAEEETDDSAA